MRTITLLGATGSIGSSALDVITRHPDRYRVHALTAQSSVDALADLAARHAAPVAVIGDLALERHLREALRARGAATVARAGAAALAEVAQAPESDTVLAAIVGAAGLVPTLAAARAGKRLLLANKEAVVMAGPLLFDALRGSGGELIPIESRDILPCQHQSHRPVARFYGDPPCNGGLIGVARTNDGQLRDGAQRRYLLDGLMGRSVFTDPDAIVGENVDHSKLH